MAVLHLCSVLEISSSSSAMRRQIDSIRSPFSCSSISPLRFLLLTNRLANPNTKRPAASAADPNASGVSKLVKKFVATADAPILANTRQWVVVSDLLMVLCPFNGTGMGDENVHTAHSFYR